MAKFRVLLQAQPEKVYRKADTKTARLLSECFEHLEADPFARPGRIKRLRGQDNLYRYRAGSLRIIYEIDLPNLRVGILAVLPRDDAYKRF